MKKVVIWHGTQGSPEGNWFRWLEAALQKRGLSVWLPLLPHAEQPSLRDWLDYAKESCPFEIDEETIVIGHSSGAVLALLLAQESSQKIGAIVCVSVFHDNSLGWDANARLFDVPFNWAKIRVSTKRQIVCLHSDDDPYVPLKQAEYVADMIAADMIVIPGQGHFNLEKSSEFSRFPYILELLDRRKLL